MFKNAIYAATAATLLSASTASAVVVDGLVTSGVGVFEKITPAPGFKVGKDNLQSKKLFAFDEKQQFTVSSDVTLDIGQLKAGTKVSSHLVAFDPRKKASQTGWISFSDKIVGVAYSLSTLLSTDIYGLDFVTYLSPTLRGIEAATDTVAINAADPYQIDISWTASTPGDTFRVFTISEVPVPATAGLLALGVGAFGVVARRRKQKKA